MSRHQLYSYAKPEVAIRLEEGRYEPATEEPGTAGDEDAGTANGVKVAPRPLERRPQVTRRQSPRRQRSTSPALRSMAGTLPGAMSRRGLPVFGDATAGCRAGPTQSDSVGRRRGPARQRGPHAPDLFAPPSSGVRHVSQAEGNGRYLRLQRSGLHP